MEPAVPRSRTLDVIALAVALAACAAAAAIAVAPSRPASAQPPTPEPWHLEPIARYGGATHAVAGEGDVLYAGLGARVVALDIGDPAAPVQVGESPVLGGVVQDLVLEGDLLYVAWQAGTVDARRGGLAVLGVADSTRMALLRQVPVDVATRRLAVVDGVALMVGSYDWQMHSKVHRGAVVSIDPRPIVDADHGERLEFEYQPVAITISGASGYALEPRVSNGDLAAVRVLDIADPLRPRPEAVLAFPGPPKSLVATPTRLYVAAGASGLRVVDIANRPRPIDLGRGSVAGACADDVALAPGALAVLDACSGRLSIHELDAAGWPVEMGRLAVTSPTTRITWIEDLVVVAQGERGGVQLVDASMLSQPAVAGSWTSEGSIGAVASIAATSSGDIIVAAHPSTGMTVLRSASSGKPLEVTGHLDGEWWKVVDMSEERIVAVSSLGPYSAGRIDMISVADPSRPYVEGSLDLPAATDVAIHPRAQVVYVSGPGLQIVDASRPNLNLTATIHREQWIVNLTLAGERLLASGREDGIEGLSVLDATDPLGPELAARWRSGTPYYTTAIAATAKRAYYARGGLWCEYTYDCVEVITVDLSNPHQPELMATQKLEHIMEPLSLEIDGAEVLMGGSDGLLVLDAATFGSTYDPLATYPAPGPVVDMLLHGDESGQRTLVTAEGDGGLGVYHLRHSSAPPPSPTSAQPLPTRHVPATSTPMRGAIAPLFLPVALRPAAAVPESPPLRVAGINAGPSIGMAVGDGIVYRGHAGAVVAIEAGPGQPREVGRSKDLPGLVFDLAVAGDRLYAAVSEVGLAVFSLADARRPVLLGTAPTGDAARGVAVSGNHAYLAAGDAGLEVYDVSDPMAPLRIGAIPVERRAWRVWLYRDHAYVRTADQTPIQIFDVGDPARPRRVGQLGDDRSYGSSVAFLGDVAYAESGDRVEAFDISDPASATLVAGWTTRIMANAIAVEGTRMYTVHDTGLGIYDLREPAAPRLVSTTEVGWPSEQIAIRDGLVAMTGDADPEDNGFEEAFLRYTWPMQLFDASNPDRLVPLGWTAPELAFVSSVLPSARPDRLYVTQYWAPNDRSDTSAADALVDVPASMPAQSPDSAWVLDVSDPDDPRLAERVTELDGVTAMAVDGTTAVALRGARTLAVLDLGATESPVTEATLALENEQLSVVLEGTTALLLGRMSARQGDTDVYTTTLSLVDIVDPTRPAIRGALSVAGAPSGFAVHDAIAWLNTQAGLYAVDVAGPSRPKIVAHVDVIELAELDWPPTSLAADDRHLWLGTHRGLVTLDVADPASPRVIGRSGGSINRLWRLEDGRLLAHDCGVTLFDQGAELAMMPVGHLESLPFAPLRCGFEGMSGWVHRDRLYAVPYLGSAFGGIVVIAADAR